MKESSEEAKGVENLNNELTKRINSSSDGANIEKLSGKSVLTTSAQKRPSYRIKDLLNDFGEMKVENKANGKSNDPENNYPPEYPHEYPPNWDDNYRCTCNSYSSSEDSDTDSDLEETCSYYSVNFRLFYYPTFL